MPTVVNAARVTTKDGAVWRECAGCGALAPLAPGVNHCPACQAEPVREYAVSVLLDLAAMHAGGPAGAAESGVQAKELNGLAGDLREAARRLRGRGRSS